MEEPQSPELMIIQTDIIQQVNHSICMEYGKSIQSLCAEVKNTKKKLHMCPVATKWVLMMVMAVMTVSYQIKTNLSPIDWKKPFEDPTIYTKLWLLEYRSHSKCTSEKSSLKIKEQNSKNYRRNNDNEPLQNHFLICWCQFCTETF